MHILGHYPIIRRYTDSVVKYAADKDTSTALVVCAVLLFADCTKCVKRNAAQMPVVCEQKRLVCLRVFVFLWVCVRR